MRGLAAVLIALALAGCAAPSVSIGSKPFAENRILAETVVLLLRDAGLRARRRFPTGDSGQSFAALRADAIDVHPEYVCTALGPLGRPRIADRDAAWAEVKAAFQSRDVSFLAHRGVAYVETPRPVTAIRARRPPRRRAGDRRVRDARRRVRGGSGAGGRRLCRRLARGFDAGDAAGADRALSAAPRRDRAAGAGRLHRGPVPPARRERPRDRRRTRPAFGDRPEPATRLGARARDPRRRGIGSTPTRTAP